MKLANSPWMMMMGSFSRHQHHPIAGAHNNMIYHPLAQPSIKIMISGSDLVPKDARKVLSELLKTRKMDEKAKGMKNAKESRKSDLKQ